MMICETCGKESYVMYLETNPGWVCPDCKDELRKKDTRSEWDKICERMEKKYGRYE
jgi:hypothetical protein